MAKTKALILILLLCLCSFFPQTIKAQNEQNPVQQDSSSKTGVPSQKMTLSGPIPEAIETSGTEQRIVRVGDFHLKAEETVGNVILIGGTAKIQGTVIGNILVLKGNVDIKPEATVKGKVTVAVGTIFGKHLLVDNKRLLGDNQRGQATERYREINGLQLAPALISLVMRPQKIWELDKQTSFLWRLLTFAALMSVHIMLVAAFPKQMTNMAKMVSHRPIGNALFGVLILVVIPCLMGVLVFSIIGIPLMFFFSAILLAMAIYGKTAIFLSMGKAIFWNQSNLVGVIVGYLIYGMAISTPIHHIDWFIFSLASTIGIGVCTRSMLGQRSNAPSKTDQRRQFVTPQKFGSR
jgi:hypothetical protein